LKCQHCGCGYSPELKKEKYVYMRPTKTKGDCSYCYHLSEEKILSQIEDVLEGMKIPENILIELNTELKKSSTAEHEHQIQESSKLQKQYQTIQTRITRARDLFLDAQISKEEYDEMLTGL
jgi:site-specific DNA recombinase